MKKEFFLEMVKIFIKDNSRNENLFGAEVKWPFQ